MGAVQSALPFPDVFATDSVCEVAHREQRENGDQDRNSVENPVTPTYDSIFFWRAELAGGIEWSTESDLTDHVASYESGQLGQGHHAARKQSVNVDQQEGGSRREQRSERKAPDGSLLVPCGIKSRHFAA